MLLAFCTASLAHADTSRPAECGLNAGETHVVTAIIDGETLQIDTGGEVRLAGIVAPRAIDTASAMRAWPPENAAIAALTRLALGQRVTLHPLTQHPDRYGRVVAHMTVAADEPVWLQAALLRSGHARAFGIAQNFVCASALLAHERAAETARAGLWTDKAYQPRAAYRTRELMRYRSTLQIVTGRVRNITVTKNAIYLEFGQDWRQDFTAGVKTGRTSAWTVEQREWLKSLHRQRVGVRGFIERRNGPYIEIGHPSQIEVLLEDSRSISTTGPGPSATQPNEAQTVAPGETVPQIGQQKSERPKP